MEESGASLHRLPSELLQRILSNEAIRWDDCCRLSFVNKRFSVVCGSTNNELWKRKLVQTWPKLFNRLYATLSDDQLSCVVWKHEFKSRYLHGIETSKQLYLLSSKHYYDGEMSNLDFEPFTNIEMKYKHKLSKYFQIDVIEDILDDGNPNDRLTVKYYAEKVMRFLKHQRLRTQWTQYLSQFKMYNDNEIKQAYTMFPTGEENLRSETNVKDEDETDVPGDLVKGAIMLSAWFQPNSYINEATIRRQIELIALLTVDELRAVYPRNQLLVERTGTCLSETESLLLSESLYSPCNCEQILVCLNNVMFIQLKFVGNNVHYYEADNSFIDKVVDRRTGIPISLCVLYQAIAAKLGVRTFLVNFPRHLLIKWKQHPELQGMQQYTYIDVFEGGRFLDHRTLVNLYDPSNLRSVDEVLYSLASPVVIFRRMCNNLIEIGRQQENSNDSLLCLRNALELNLLINPEDIESRMLLSRVYIHLNINLSEVEIMLSEISSRDPPANGIVMFLRQSVDSQLYGKKRAKKTVVKTREKNDVKFAVGMNMHHKRYNYSCVIFGWDPKCAASRDWIIQMGVNNLPNKEKQPFYNVLVDDGSTRYAAQENLEIETHPRLISHSEVGKYFSSFDGRHYVPNEEKRNEYPDDEQFVISLLSQTNDS
ncbi:F-box only protein 21-like protein [Leptotrombidium deliense]|uniref:F-box only protein 21-like protein n=1 Tax=Leptotrombidium deliense TaxID=299467 RepID=A0A443SRE9_9ACAR|nr:F-box only protein 21-like protein [Leptotrombidium deliense]